MKVDNSTWFYEFDYCGERKRIHRFEHLPFDLAVKINKDGKSDVMTVLGELLERDCGLSVSDFDYKSMSELIEELSKDGASLGE